MNGAATTQSDYKETLTRKCDNNISTNISSIESYVQVFIYIFIHSEKEKTEILQETDVCLKTKSLRLVKITQRKCKMYRNMCTEVMFSKNH